MPLKFLWFEPVCDWYSPSSKASKRQATGILFNLLREAGDDMRKMRNDRDQTRTYTEHNPLRQVALR